MSTINKIHNEVSKMREMAKITRKIDKIDKSNLNLSIYAYDFEQQIKDTDDFERKEVFNMKMNTDILEIIINHIVQNIDKTLSEFNLEKGQNND